MHAVRFASLGLTGALLLACSCSDDASTGAPGTSGTGGAGLGSTTGPGAAGSTSSSGGAAGGGNTGGVPIPKPCPGYEGWETWDDFAPDGDFCVPASVEALPEPIVWEPCPAVAGMPVGCQQMQVTWPTDADPITSGASGWVERDGTVHLQFARNATVDAKRHRTQVIAEASGPVRSAFLDMNGNNAKWTAFSAEEKAGVRQGHFVFYVLQWNLDENYPQAAVGGVVGELHPKALHIWNPSVGYSVGAASDFWVARSVGEIYLAGWDGAPELVHTAALGDGGQLVGFFPFGDMLFWVDQPWPSSALWAYKKGSASAYPLIPHNPTKHIAGFGTDGTHMVWVVSHDVKSSYTLTPFEDGARDIMVSPYAETPAGLAPQRLRSYPSIYGIVQRFAVGCGYAAHADVGGAAGDAWLVRLADGSSWELLGASCPPGNAEKLCVKDVLAITCQEVFVLVGGTGGTNIARISIEALGAPSPPD